MTERWRSAHSAPPGDHLPPLDIVPALRTYYRGKIAPAYMLETPLDEYGVPDPEQVVVTIAREIAAPYRWPSHTNIHHIAWPRRAYAKSPIEQAYREDTSLRMMVPIQFHNLAHKIMTQPPIPPYDVMYQRVLEQRQRNVLFEYGRRALRYARWSDQLRNLTAEEVDEAWLENTRGFFGTKARIEMDKFNRTLEKSPISQVGILPNREELSQLGIASATKLLGRQAAAVATDYRHFIQEATSRKVT